MRQILELELRLSQVHYISTVSIIYISTVCSIFSYISTVNSAVYCLKYLHIYISTVCSIYIYISTAAHPRQPRLHRRQAGGRHPGGAAGGLTTLHSGRCHALSCGIMHCPALSCTNCRRGYPSSTGRTSSSEGSRSWTTSWTPASPSWWIRTICRWRGLI